MGAPYNSLRSKNNRAIVAYLASEGAGTLLDIFPFDYGALKAYPNTVVDTSVGHPEVMFSGLYRCRVQLIVRGTESQPNNGQPVNPAAPRQNFDTRVGNTFDAMMQSDDDGRSLFATARAITAAAYAAAAATPKEFGDLVDYTCTNVYEAGFGRSETIPDACAWQEILLFDVVCCASAVS